MDDPAVVTGLMPCNRVFFLHNSEPNAGSHAERLKRRRQPNDPATDNHEIKFEVHVRNCIRLSGISGGRRLRYNPFFARNSRIAM